MPDGTLLQPQEIGPFRESAQNEQVRLQQVVLQPQPTRRHPRLRLLEQGLSENL